MKNENKTHLQKIIAKGGFSPYDLWRLGLCKALWLYMFKSGSFTSDIDGANIKTREQMSLPWPTVKIRKVNKSIALSSSQKSQLSYAANLKQTTTECFEFFTSQDLSVSGTT